MNNHSEKIESMTIDKKTLEVDPAAVIRRAADEGVRGEIEIIK
jgi:hypothetical protein